MKLSEKGYLKIGNSIVAWVDDGVIKVTFDRNKIEFEPDDFEMPTTPNGNEINKLDAKTEDLPTTLKEVRLTVEEAKILETFCWGCASLLSTEEDAVYDKLVKRIEQAEKGDA